MDRRRKSKKNAPRGGREINAPGLMRSIPDDTMLSFMRDSLESVLCCSFLVCSQESATGAAILNRYGAGCACPSYLLRIGGCDRSCDVQSRLSELVVLKDHLWKCSLGTMQVDKEDHDIRLQPKNDASDNTPSPSFLLKGGWVGSSLDLSFGAFGPPSLPVTDFPIAKWDRTSFMTSGLPLCKAIILGLPFVRSVKLLRTSSARIFHACVREIGARLHLCNCPRLKKDVSESVQENERNVVFLYANENIPAVDIEFSGVVS